MEDIDSAEILSLINRANNLSLKKGYNEISLERAVFLSWWCDKGDCKFCYMSTQKDKIKEPQKARRRVGNILAEAEMCHRLGWNIEFLSGGYKSFTTQEIKSIAQNIHDITGDGVWLNTGITEELEEYGEEIKGITGAVEAANPEFQKEVCPSKPLDQISAMLDKMDTGVLDGGDYENAALSYSDAMRLIEKKKKNLANIGVLILSGANGITKFPLFKMFGTKYGKRVEEEIKWTGRSLKGTFTDKSRLGPEKSEVDPKLDRYIKRYIKDSLKNKFQ